MDWPLFIAGFVGGAALIIVPRAAVTIAALCAAFFVLWRLLA